MAQNPKRPTDGQKISTLVRIFRGAVASQDDILRRAAIAELSELGVDVAELLTPMNQQAEVPHDVTR